MKVVTKENLELYDSKLKGYIDEVLGNNLDTLSYGVSWKPNVGDPHLTRVGNLDYHKTLPIQNNIKGCIALMKDGARIMYYLNPDDWRFRTDNTILENQTLVVTTTSIQSLLDKVVDIYTLKNSIFSNLRYEHQYLKVNGADIFKIESIDTITETATLVPSSEDMMANIYEEGENIVNVELGAVLNGYDGEVMVEVPEFWIKSWDTDIRREVRISPTKIDDTWEHLPRILISPYRDTVLNTVPDNMGYLSILKKGSAVSICNVHDYCRGGNNDSSYDQYLESDVFRTMIGKPRTYVLRSSMRAYTRLSGKEVLSYLQYKRVLYWLYTIEYANFNCLEEFNPALTSEGYKQGGLGNGVTTVNGIYWQYYNGINPLTPNGYTNEFGNSTNIKAMKIVMPTTSGGDPTSPTIQYVPRWHGIENTFGDIWNNVEGIIINSSSIVEGDKNYSEVYATDDPTLYSDDDYKSMKRVGIELKGVGYIEEWDLGNTAEIIPRLNGGNTTQYKCDYHLTSAYAGLRALFLGGYASASNDAGLGSFRSLSGVGLADVNVGFRTSCIIK